MRRSDLELARRESPFVVFRFPTPHAEVVLGGIPWSVLRDKDSFLVVDTDTRRIVSEHEAEPEAVRALTILHAEHAERPWVGAGEALMNPYHDDKGRFATKGGGGGGSAAMGVPSHTEAVGAAEAAGAKYGFSVKAKYLPGEHQQDHHEARLRRSALHVAAASDKLAEVGLGEELKGLEVTLLSRGASKGAIHPNTIAEYKQGTLKTVLVNSTSPAFGSHFKESPGSKSTDASTHTFVHEVGHRIYEKYRTEKSGGQWKADQALMHKAGVEKKVSRYAQVHRWEFVAEVFAGMAHGKSYPSEVMSLYDKWTGPKMPRPKGAPPWEQHFNPNHDQRGRFATGGGGSGVAEVAHFELARFDANQPRAPRGSTIGGQWVSAVSGPIPTTAVDAQGMKKVGGKLGGSSDGGQYIDADGNAWYVKTASSPEAARQEALAARLYRLTGAETAEVHLGVDANGNPAVASKLVPTEGAAGPGHPGALENFAADAWLANWDVAGQSHDNLLVSNGKAVRMDMGGALEFRAQGKPKYGGLPNEVSEMNTLRDPGVNAQTAAVFGGMSKGQILDSIGRLEKVSDADINAAFDGLGFPPAKRAALAATIIARKNYLLDIRSAELKAKAAGPQKDYSGKLYKGDDPIPFKDNRSHLLQDPANQSRPPLIPSGPQLRALREAGSFDHSPSSWDAPDHPRPDDYGVPTNPNSAEYKRLAQAGRSMLNDWSGDAQSKGATLIKRAAGRVFNANGIAYNDSYKQESEQERWDNDRVVRMIYKDTQYRLHEAGVTADDRVHLFRGVKGTVTTPGILEGHSAKLSKAKDFAGSSGQVFDRAVHPSEIFVDHRSAMWNDGFDYEREYLVFAGGFGAPATKTKVMPGGVKSAVKTINTYQQNSSLIPGLAGTSGAKTYTPPTAATPAIAKPAAPAAAPTAYTISPAAIKAASAPALSPADASLVAAIKATKPKKTYAKVTDAAIVKVKEMHISGSKFTAIAKETGLSNGVIVGILQGSSKKYAQTGPRLPGMAKKLGISPDVFSKIKAAAVIGKVPLDVIAKQYGIPVWKVQAVAYSKKKGT
jgi:hypothetical protein